MKLYPYSKLETKNLKTFLFASRALTLAALIILLTTFIIVAQQFFTGGPQEAIGPNIRIVSPRVTQLSLYMLAWGIPTAALLAFLGGIGAAVVSWENQLSTKAHIKTE